MQEEISLECKLRVYVGDTPFLGIGRIELLEKIIHLGSISQAAQAMHMSYRKAWQLVENMNQLSEKPLVIKKTGGKTGGGAMVTEQGKMMIKKYHHMTNRLEIFLTDLQKEIQL